jgi:tetratricopeptide (TPR) repeat protein
MVSQSIVPSIALSLLLLDSSKAAHATTPPPQSEPIRAELLTQSGAIAIQLLLSNNLELSLPLFNRAIQVAETIPEKSAKSQALATIALKLSEAKQTQRSQQLFDRAIQVANQIPSDQVQPRQEALRDISIQLAQAGQIPRSLQLVKTISSEFRKAQALNTIATILVDRGNVRQAKAVLVEAAQFARGIHGDYAYESNGSCGNDKFEVLSKIAGSLSVLSQFDQALRIANSVKGCGSATGEMSQDYQVPKPFKVL